MAEFTRRAFLVRSSVTAAAAGLAVALPGVPALIGGAEADAPEATDELSAAGSATADSMTEPLIAHIKDLSTGEMSIFSGTSEVVYRDPQLAARLFQASR